MTWFKVDDQLAFHRKATLAGNPAMGLWVRAGSWCAGDENGDIVPDAIVTALGGTKAQCQRLVKVGLWHRADGGYRFHDWHDFQPSALDLRLAKEKESESGTKGNHKKWHVNRNIVNPECPLCVGVK